MGIAERKERERQQRIEAILDAAEEVFEKKGFRFATMDDIAEKAELSKGTIYLYFKSKEQLFVGLDLRGTRKLFEYFEKAVEGQSNGMTKVLEIGKAYYQFSCDYPSYFHAMSRFEKFEIEEIKQVLNEPIVQEAHKAGEAVLTILATAIQEGIDDGTIRSGIDPMSTAISLWALSNGVILMYSYRGDHLRLTNGIEPDFLLDYYNDFIERALKP